MANQMKGKTQPVNWSYAPRQPHLPPKSPFPSMGPAFVDYSPSPFMGQRSSPHAREGYRQHQRTSSESILIEEQPSWLDDLLNEPETPVKKGSHRRSASDSVTFLDVPSTISRIENIAEAEFDRSAKSLFSRTSSDADWIDHEYRTSNSYQAKSKKPPIRSWDASVNLGTAYKGGSNNARESRKIANLGASSLTQDSESATTSVVKREEQQECDGHDATSSYLEGKDTSHFKQDDPDVDQKRTKQHFAQRSRVRKLQYISELERNVSALQAEESEVSAEVAFLNQQRIILTLENQALKQRITGLAQEKLIKDAEHELLIKEAQRLKHLYQQQQMQQHSSLQPSHMHQLPTSLDLDLQQLQFSKLSLGTVKPVDSMFSMSNGVFGQPKDTGGMSIVDGNDGGTTHRNGRSEVSKGNIPSSCMIAGTSKKLDGRRMMTGGGLVPVDFMLQNS